MREVIKMTIRIAGKNDFEAVKEITHKTISEVYPKYYPEGAVKFFHDHHSDERIMRDIELGIVYLLITDEGDAAGTVTISDNEIDRLFVLPSYQHKGYGRALIDLAEEKIAEKHDVILIHVSLPAKKIYRLRGFKEVEYNILDTGYGDYLCFDKMEKTV